jgi:Alpha 1,4-glycosyltransferase conserved region/Glycosyltransferase sugar-binding region containing DXD motif
MERLSISSFLAHGHEYHLYAYDHVENAPHGTTFKDAATILPRDWMFMDSRGTPSGFSNFFRYKLLLERGGWWVDSDIVCLQPFDFEDPTVLSLEPDLTIGSAVIRMPPQSDVMARAWDECAALDRRNVPWGAVGPSLLIRIVEELGLTGTALAHKVFFPFDWRDWQRVLDPDVEWEFDPMTRSIHLWNSMWSLAGSNKDAIYPSRCLYERLKTRYCEAA